MSNFEIVQTPTEDNSAKYRIPGNAVLGMVSELPPPGWPADGLASGFDRL